MDQNPTNLTNNRRVETGQSHSTDWLTSSNVSHQQQFFSELPSPYMNYSYSWVQTIYYVIGHTGK